jgi:hypothetical protein
MAVPSNNLKELHNFSLLHPVVIAAGCTLEHIKHDFNKVDVSIMGCNWESAPQLNAQLKATSSNYTIDKIKQTINYPLDAMTYNMLRGDNFTPTILVLAIIPKDESERVIVQNDDLLLKGQLYWFYIQGDRVDNKSNKTIYIPLANKLSIDAIKKLMGDLHEHGPTGLSK